MKYFKFCYKEKDNEIDENITKLNEYCSFMAIMYEYYFKPIKTNGIVGINIAFIERTFENIEVSTEKDLFINYNHKILLNKPIAKIHKILLDIIQNNIIEYVKENHWNTGSFENAYNSIVNNNYLFEENYLRSKSNKIYKAQISFKHDYQNSGTYLNIYKENKLINKIQFSPSASPAIERYITSMEWTDEKNIKIYYKGGQDDKKYYWKIDINGEMEFGSMAKNNPHLMFYLGKVYYEGLLVMQNKEKGIELIKTSAEMGYKHAKNWIKKNMI
jgi:hypothetical protein